MRMSLGDNMVVTLFGESHGPAVGALIEGMPPNIELDAEQLVADMIARRPGSGLASKRKETDEVEILSGVHSGKSTGMPILLLIKNRKLVPLRLTNQYWTLFLQLLFKYRSVLETASPDILGLRFQAFGDCLSPI